MADGDDRPEENESNHQQNDGSELPNIENLQVEELGESDLEGEYCYLNGQLEQLGACLDKMDSRSDDLLSKVRSMIEAAASDSSEAETTTSDDRPDTDDSKTAGTGVGNNS